MSRPAWLDKFAKDNDAELENLLKVMARYAIQHFLITAEDATTHGNKSDPNDSSVHLRILQDMIQERLDVEKAVTNALLTPGTTFVHASLDDAPN